MEKDFQKTVFYRSFMTCVFVGFAATVLAMGYDLFFVEFLQFPFSAIINVATLIFAVNLAFLVIGFLFYACLAASKKGETLFTVLMITATVFFAWKIQGVHRTDNTAINTQFRYLATGIILILGVLAAVAVPLLFHNRKFDEYVL